MSLHCELTINGNQIRSVHATRVSGGTGPDDINIYDAAVLDAHSITKWFGFVSHRYGDGVWGLVQRVLEASGEVS